MRYWMSKDVGGGVRVGVSTTGHRTSVFASRYLGDGVRVGMSTPIATGPAAPAARGRTTRAARRPRSALDVASTLVYIATVLAAAAALYARVWWLVAVLAVASVVLWVVEKTRDERWRTATRQARR